MNYSALNTQLVEFLNQAQIVEGSQLQAAWQQAEKKELFLGPYLVELGLVSDTNMGKIIADLYKLPFIQLSQVVVPTEVLKVIPEIVAKKQKTIAFKIDPKGLHVATSQPGNQLLLDFLAKKTGLTVIPYYATDLDVGRAFTLYTKSIKATFDELIAGTLAQAKKTTDNDLPIIEIVNTLMKYAYHNRASDIHIEPLDAGTLVRFRIDGELLDVISFEAELGPQIVTSIKVMAHLRTDEHQEPQDGKITFIVDNDAGSPENLDLRVSIVPITKGEKVVMRLLSERARQFSLQDLGFASADLEKIEQAYSLPHGMILSTGPTGSGKTTTLYAILKLLNKRNVNIMTIEDPVEYDMENVNQIQVNTLSGLTFSKGLRSIVRQDPNIILVGEVRDEETADIAVNSAMTGHLVLSTLHTNDAVTTFPRLTDMKVEPYLVASSVKVIIGQRLVRKICVNCRVSEKKEVESLGPELQKYLADETTLQTYKGKGCDVCHQTGYEGRVGVFEVLFMSDELSEAVIAQKGAAELRDIAIKSGMRPMLQDGLEKVKQGVTTLEELLRVTKE